MCGIAGVVHLRGGAIPELQASLDAMNHLQQHRGPDGLGVWMDPQATVGFAHRRLSIIDLETGAQPMRAPSGACITYNGEIYNYLELRAELESGWTFRTTSDTEVILAAYERWGADCVERFRGMFAFAVWDERARTLFCARDRFGIKPFHYLRAGDLLYFASEAKALLPFVPQIDTDVDALREYLTFQFCLGDKTLFKGIKQLLPAHVLRAGGVAGHDVSCRRYWEVYYDVDHHHTSAYFEERLLAVLSESVDLHLRSDVPVGAYISGGLDSSIVAALATGRNAGPLVGFNGRFEGAEYDESGYARALAAHHGFELLERTITADDFVRHIADVVRHLDYPVAGPGAFPQYIVSQLAATRRKVVLGGQGGDEIFGGYTRYLIAYFEQCIKAAIDGTMHNGNFVVTYESIIPNLTALKPYAPLLQEFWRDGLFGPMDLRYFRLINRAPTLADEIDWDAIGGDQSPIETFRAHFHGANVRKESYFDLMTHFDFKTLLPALLHVEDRVSMAHGLESRVPLLDHPLVELAATIPADIKFRDGRLKHVFKAAFGHLLPARILDRQDKMGFPTPLTEYAQGPANAYVRDVFATRAARTRPFMNARRVLERLDTEPKFGRTLWGLLSLELWQQAFHDQEASFKRLVDRRPEPAYQRESIS